MVSSSNRPADDLLSFVDTVSRNSRLRVEDDLGDGFVRLRVSEAERRQAKQDIRNVEDAVIELLRNARDAHARNIFLSSSRSGSVRTLTIIDDGDGIPASMREKVFEPRVTSKLDSMLIDEWGVHGRGMALFSIRENAASAEVLDSVIGGGTSIRVLFDCSRMPERADQSTSPKLISENGVVSVGPGPHNIIKTVAEFALANKDVCTVYLGSPVDIAATLYAIGSNGDKVDEAADPRLCDSLSRGVALVRRLSRCSDAGSFMQTACALGLAVSGRSAYRAMGSSAPVSPILDQLSVQKKGPSKKKVDLSKDYRGLKVHPDDLSDFSHGLSAVFSDFADRYFLSSDVEPDIRIVGDEMRVVIPLRKDL